MTSLLRTMILGFAASVLSEASTEGSPAPAPVEQKVIDKKNGVKRPDPTSVTGKLWGIADRISTALKRPAPRKDVVDAYMKEVPNANEATANTQYARWVTYHGASDVLRKQRQEETEARQKAADKEKADKKALADKERADKAKLAADAKAAKDKEKADKKALADKERADKAKLAADAKAAKDKEKADKVALDAKVKADKEAAAAKKTAEAAAKPPAPVKSTVDEVKARRDAKAKK